MTHTIIRTNAAAASHTPILANSSCGTCSQKNLCLLGMINTNDFYPYRNAAQQQKLLHAGDYLYKAGNKFQSVFMIRAGAIKNYINNEDGIEQVTGFYLPGDMAGFDGIGNPTHNSNMVALETTSVCEIPFEYLEELAANIPLLQHNLFKLMSTQIQADYKMMLTLTKKSAEARIAIFLLNLSRRFQRRNLSATRLRLPYVTHGYGKLSWPYH
jgi:CRP/FNR family transcriptional regulator, anaerobic regulatory protein